MIGGEGIADKRIRLRASHPSKEGLRELPMIATPKQLTTEDFRVHGRLGWVAEVRARKTLG